MEKRSLTLAGHRTSLALEPAFWAGLETIAGGRGISLPALVGSIDRARSNDAAGGLASAVRVAVLDHFRTLAGEAGTGRHRPAVQDHLRD
ncbi:ribbon-helix-helix domain-containing protein [Pseudoxanthobacter sp.]|uniref:ribbon-helix-helix domain-containing protein n=1 Tax=Pseudoxanthobacter sp. TaxID=1925742 RepID=UPI002FE3CC02